MYIYIYIYLSFCLWKCVQPKVEKTLLTRPSLRRSTQTVGWCVSNIRFVKFQSVHYKVLMIEYMYIYTFIVQYLNTFYWNGFPYIIFYLWLFTRFSKGIHHTIHHVLTYKSRLWLCCWCLKPCVWAVDHVAVVCSFSIEVIYIYTYIYRYLSTYWDFSLQVCQSKKLIVNSYKFHR